MAQGAPLEPSVAQPPSRRAIARACLGALAVALFILVAFILPAEYGIDPLGTGKAFGLTALADAANVDAPVPPPQGEKLAPVQEGPIALYPGSFKVDSREFVLGPYEYVEYKYDLQQGATLLFSWRATGDVAHDFHGAPEGAPSSAEQSFDKRARRQADGSFTAPFSGIHGWYWENPGGDPVTVRLTTSGFYTAAHEFSFDRTRTTRAVRALDTIAPEAGAKEAP